MGAGGGRPSQRHVHSGEVRCRDQNVVVSLTGNRRSEKMLVGIQQYVTKVRFHRRRHAVVHADGSRHGPPGAHREKQPSRANGECCFGHAAVKADRGQAHADGARGRGPPSVWCGGCFRDLPDTLRAVFRVSSLSRLEQKTVATKAAAVEKTLATRAARQHDRDGKQKEGIKGTPPERQYGLGGNVGPGEDRAGDSRARLQSTESRMGSSRGSMRLPSNGTVPRGEGGGLRPSALPAFLAGRDSAPRQRRSRPCTSTSIVTGSNGREVSCSSALRVEHGIRSREVQRMTRIHMVRRCGSLRGSVRFEQRLAGSGAGRDDVGIREWPLR